jgi:hypothetical protein
MSEVNLFLLAAKRKYRFDSVRGALTVEQLFDLPLTSRSDFDLDTVARSVNAELKALGEESFVQPANNIGRLELSRKLDIVKLIIAEKQAAAAANEARVVKAEKRRKILEALDVKENEALTSASREDLLKKLAELDEPEELEAA